MTPKRFFYSLSGEDFSIIRKSSDAVKSHFALIGVLVGCVSALCFVSFASLFINLTSSLVVGVVMAIFFAWMIMNLYVLVLYTLSKNVLPSPSSRIATLAPTVIKYGFLILLAVFVSKPLELFVFKARVEDEINDYKKVYLVHYAQLANERFLKETKEIRAILEGQKLLHKDSLSRAKNPDWDMFIAQKERERDSLVKAMHELVMSSDFYVQRIILLCTREPFSWFFTACMIGLFLAPVVIKQRNIGNEYYQLKLQIETRIVVDGYNDFVQNYNGMMIQKYGKEYAWKEIYLDPPFNTKRIAKLDNNNSETELINLIYHG